MNRRTIIDIAERVFWTAVQAGLGAIAVTQLNVPPAAGVAIAASLAWTKGFVATKVGAKGTAATVPAHLDQVTG